MPTITRRSFLEMAAVLGATAVWGNPFGTKSYIHWQERRDLFPEGVASGDPDSHSVLLWTRCPQPREDSVLRLNVEVSEDDSFRPCRRNRFGFGFRRIRLDLPRLGRRSETRPCLLVPIHKYRRPWQPHRQDPHGSSGGRPQAGSLCIRELPERYPGSPKRLPENDFRGRACLGGGPPRLRAASRRFHLRDRMVSGGSPTGNV